MDARPYTRSLHPDDYAFLEHTHPLRLFEQSMTAFGIPHREWHEHRFWEYASIMQQLDELHVPINAQLVDVGAGASFFDPYCALHFQNLCCVDNMQYGDITPMVDAQRRHFGVGLPLHDMPLENMAAFKDEQFDVTLCISTIEHASGHEAAFNELVRITKPGGYLFVTSDYFRDMQHFENSVSRIYQVTPYTQKFVLALPQRFPVAFVGETDLVYRGNYVHNYSFVNICLRKLW
jgi:SAM-dependent methyltransferase